MDAPYPHERARLTSGFNTLGIVLLILAAVLAVVGAAGVVTGGINIELGSIRISATRPTRLFYQAAVAWLLSEAVGRARKRPAFALLPILALFAAGIADSTPRRIGDGDEYVAMALNLSRGAPPALSASELAALGERLETTPGFNDALLQRPLQGRDGRQD